MIMYPIRAGTGERRYEREESLVAMEIIASFRAGGDHDESLAVESALLHDTLEDTSITRERLTEEFGDDVAARLLEKITSYRQYCD